MADNSLNPDLTPVLWTTAATTREPRKEGQGDGKKRRPVSSPAPEPDSGEPDPAEDGATEDSSHKLDRFA